MKYLVDSSVWLEALLDQEQAAEVVEFLTRVPLADLAVTDFAVFSIALKMIRHDRRERYLEFVADLLADDGVHVIRLPPSAVRDVFGTMDALGLDFDDGLQYEAAKSYGLTLVSFDHHFDTTPLGRKSPREVTPPPPGVGGG